MSKTTRYDILSLDACSLSKKLQSGKTTAAEVMTATLDHIDEVNEKFRAIIMLRDREELMEEARICDEMKSPKGRLHGIPIAIKDVSNVVGLPTTMGGSPLFDNFRPSRSDPFVRKIIAEGAIVIGKTNAPEHGLGSHTYNARWGRTLNPYNTSKSCGGSSGGAAVALATRMLCIADGTDMMGSLRNPAGWNNIYSHRPTSGLVESDDPKVNPLPYPISTPGPMARTPLDVAMLLEVMAEKRKFDSSLILDAPNIEGLRVAWLGDCGGAYPFEDGILPLCRSALDILATKGSMVEDMTGPFFDSKKLWKSWTTIRSKILSSVMVAAHGVAAFSDESTVKPELKWEVFRGLEIPDDAVEEAVALQKEWFKFSREIFKKYDIIALPSAQMWPFSAETDWPKTISGQAMNTYHAWMEVLIPASLGGLPCATIPAGFGENGLPMGVQLIGKRWSDIELLNVAQAYHIATDWPSKKYPFVNKDMMEK